MAIDYSKQKPSLGLLASTIVLSLVCAVQLAVNNNAIYAQTATPIVTGRCEESPQGVLARFDVSNLNPESDYYVSFLRDGMPYSFRTFLVPQGSESYEIGVGYGPAEYTINVYEEIDNNPNDNPEPEELVATETVTCNASPAAGNEELISDVQNLQNVPQGTKTSLTAPLKEASTILNDDNPNNDRSACGKLDAFIRETNASERRGTITAVQADDLRAQAEDIRTQLGC